MNMIPNIFHSTKTDTNVAASKEIINDTEVFGHEAQLYAVITEFLVADLKCI